MKRKIKYTLTTREDSRGSWVSLEIFSTLFLTLLMIFSCNTIKNLPERPAIKNISIYFVEWKTKYRLPITINNIKKRHVLSAQMSGDDFSEMFESYADFKDKLQSQIKLKNQSSNRVDILAVFSFGLKREKVYFRANGDYYFKGNWYESRLNFSYLLFKGFSNDYFDTEIWQKLKVEDNTLFW